MSFLNNKRKLTSLHFLAFTIFLISIACQDLLSQPESEFKNEEYGKGRIRTIEGYEISFSKITIGLEEHRYLPVNSNKEQLIRDDQTIRIEIQKGNFALEYGAILGISAAAVGVYQVNKGSISSSVALLTSGLCFLVGLAGGSAVKKYVTIYENPRFNPSISISPKNINLTNNNSLMIRLNYHL